MVEADWVAIQAHERRLREIETNEREYEQRLSEMRKREDTMRNVVSARVAKKIVRK